MESVLDFGAGTGILAALERMRGASVTCLDVDAIALRAAGTNVPDAMLILGDGLGPAVPGNGAPRYERIVTNPPIHLGKAESLDAVGQLVTLAPEVVRKRGSLWMVIQRRFAVGPMLRECFRQVDVRTEDDVFRVWEARRPIQGRSRGKG